MHFLYPSSKTDTHIAWPELMLCSSGFFMFDENKRKWYRWIRSNCDCTLKNS